MADYSKYHNGNSFSNGNGNHNYFDQIKAANSKKEEGKNLKEIVLVIWSKKWIIASSMLIGGLVAFIIASSMIPVYQSEGSILIRDTSSRVGDGQGLAGMMSEAFGIGGGSTIENELLILKSRSLSRAIADSLMEVRYMKNGEQFPILYKDYPDDSTMADKNAIAHQLRKKLTFSQVNEKADMIKIAYESPSPLEAAYVIDVTMDIYTDFSTRRKRTSASAAVTFLKQERARIKDSLNQAEEQLRDFMNRTNLVNVDTQTEEMIQQMAALQAELQQAKAKLESVNSGIAQYKERLDKIKPGLAEQFANAPAPNMRRLQIALAELRLQKTKLLTSNPGIENRVPVPQELAVLNNKIQRYTDKIKELTQNLLNKGDIYLSFFNAGRISKNLAEINRSLIKLKVQQQQYQAQIDILSAQIAKMEGFMQGLPDNIMRLAELKREVMLNENLFGIVSQQYAKMSLLQETQFGLGYPIDTGYIPESPVKPKTILFILVGMVLGGVFSTGYVFVRESFKSTIDSVDFMKNLRTPLLAVIPQMDDHTKEHYDGKSKISIQNHEVSTKLVTMLDNISPIAESFRRLQNNIIYTNPDRELKSIMVTSPDKGAGKTTTASNLGIVLAEAGRDVIIVDTDLRRPNVHNTFGLSKTPGFMEVLFDDITLDDAIKETILPGLSILPSGHIPPNPAAVTQSKAFLEVVKKVESHYDYVIIDTPPIGIITDSSPAIRSTDGIIVVTRFNQTTEIQLNHTLEQLERLNGNILGTVLTAFDYSKSSDYYYSTNYYKEAYKDYEEYKRKGT